MKRGHLSYYNVHPASWFLYNRYLVLFFFLLLSVTPVAAQSQTTERPKLYINEILASNGSGIEDEDGDTVPWIELYNAGSKPVNLRKYALSDDYDRPWRWLFPNVDIEPGEFLLIFASGKNRDIPGQPLHTNFRISSSGEEVLLTDIDGNRIDDVPPTPLDTDISYGRQPDGSDYWYFFSNPTPGESNNQPAFQDIAPEPMFSHTGGFYSRDFYLEMDSHDPNTTIYYTLDGSEPDSTSLIYREPILITDQTLLPNNLSTIMTSPEGKVMSTGFEWVMPQGHVFKGNVIRAKASIPGHKSSNTITHSYFVDNKSPNRYPLSVLSLATDSLHLFDYETGIYIPGKIFDDQDGNDRKVANYFQRGPEWEKPASFELFDENGNRVHSQDIGIRVHGWGSRTLSQKSLRLYARNEYGDNRFYYPVFPDLPYRSYNRLILRNSGQDFFVRSTMFRDAFLQKLIGGLNFDTQAYRPVIVFINGEYWGIQNLRERYDEYYFERVYGVNPDNIDHLSENMEIKSGDSLHFSALREFVSKHDLSDSSHYEYVKTQMDIDNYLDYIVAQTFIRNIDWPGNNQDYWRLRVPYNPDAPPGHDGRWRWVLIDTDAAFGLLNPFRVESFNMLNHFANDTYDEWPNHYWSTILIRALLENEPFRQDFINRSAELMNTIFKPNHVISLIDSFEEKLEPVIEEHILRWGQIESKSQWHSNIERMRDFAKKRPGYHRQHISDFFNLDGTIELTVDVSSLQKGRMQVHRTIIDEETKGLPSDISPYPWKGTFFKNTPITIRALPYRGYEFSHWKSKGSRIDHPSDSLTLTPKSDLHLTAVFVTSEDDDWDPVSPRPHRLSKEDYHFSSWDPDSEAGTYPTGMVFQYMDSTDPGLYSEAAGVTNGAYNLTSRTRINGLGVNGFSFINTSNPDGNPGYPGTRLGAAVLALDSRDMKDLNLSWTGGTVTPNSRVYHLRLQYRIDRHGPFNDLIGADGEPIEYQRHHIAGHEERFSDLRLPASLENKPHIELRWKYYHTGEQLLSDSGSRAELRISDIHVSGAPITGTDHDGTGRGTVLNYPNPFNNQTTLRIELPQESLVSIRVFDINGRLVDVVLNQARLRGGAHTIRLQTASWASGVYIYQIDTDNGVLHGKMTRMK